MASEEDKELEQELAEAEEANNPDALDETIFNKFATGELDIPEDADDVDAIEDSEPDEVDEDSELEAYYEELGIDPSEMHEKRKKSGEERLYRKQKKADKKKSRLETAKRERNDIISAMMEKARKEPSYKTLTRIIQIVKAVFVEKIDQSKKKDDDDEMEEEEQEESKTLTEAQKNKKFSQSLAPEEYQRLVQFFATELPKLALKVCQVKDFPNVDKMIQQSKFKGVKIGSGSQFSLKSAFPGINKKNQNMLKSYASNFNRLLAHYSSSEPGQEVNNDMITVMLSASAGAGAEAVKCCLPFKVYTKKLANNCAKVAVHYSQCDGKSIILAFNTLRSLVMWA